MTSREDAHAREAAHRRLATALGVEAPFPWQLALLGRFLDGTPPSAIDVPTGLGKTAVIAIWLVARAAGARVPRRLVYVVDRRAVVDQATTVAEDLRKLVDGAPDLKAALGLDGPLPISTLRGKHVDNREWLADPGAPAIVLGTVDMVGSRLLFGGYGVSRRMRPYHAGLLGADSLIVLDEAHLVPPFERLIDALASGRDERGRALGPEGDLAAIVPPLQFLSLSATGRSREGTLFLSEADRAHPVVSRRLGAKKRAILRDEVGARDLAEKLAGEAWSLSEAGAKALRCIVFCNSRDDAKKVQDGLESHRKSAGQQLIDVELFVGGRRLHEREQAAKWLHNRGFLAGSQGRPERATFVIATSAGEVGVDLDADHMVCDLVAWERMVQRLGRVNRRGEGDARVIVVPAEAQEEAVRGRLHAVRELLQELPSAGDDERDASPGALVLLKAQCAREPALAALLDRGSTPAELHPPLPRPTVEAWSMTSLEEHAGRPEVAPWIRGFTEDEPQTTVVWRRHLPVTDRGALFSKADLETFRDAADPHLIERLETETFRVVEWLAKRLKTLKAPDGSDASVDPTERPLRATDIAAVILDGPIGARVLRADDLSSRDKREDVDRALRGGLLLVDTRLGGLSAGLLSAESDEAHDISEIEGPDRVVPFRVRRVMKGEEPAGREWRAETRIAVDTSEDGEKAWLLVESLIREAAESEEGRSAGAKRAQTLEEHETWTERAAARIAERLGLPKPYAGMLQVAARLHDEGKRAKRWQEAFRAPPNEAYAKTTSRPSLKLLEGYRHELGSLPYAERHERLRALDQPLRELALHLIAAHHGHARPLIRTQGAEEPPTRLVERAQEIASCFARLEKRWGPWGLAWWEALLRAADQQASRENDLETEVLGGDVHG
jgi:CRISPR-associated endonuclease/helicase Cas3